jgi:EAL domain-containing protein (putative c-di-GMP-specific phosphodiesterase class I)
VNVQILGSTPNSAAALELEVTESLIMEDVRHSVVTLHAIRAMGVTIAIDDFGTGPPRSATYPNCRSTHSRSI